MCSWNRKAFFTLRSENDELKSRVTGKKPPNDGRKNTSDRSDGQLVDAFGTEVSLTLHLRVIFIHWFLLQSFMRICVSAE